MFNDNQIHTWKKGHAKIMPDYTTVMGPRHWPIIMTGGGATHRVRASVRAHTRAHGDAQTSTWGATGAPRGAVLPCGQAHTKVAMHARHCMHKTAVRMLQKQGNKQWIQVGEGEYPQSKQANGMGEGANPALAVELSGRLA